MTALKRLFSIIAVVIRFRLDSFINPALLPTPLRVLYYLAPWHYLPACEETRGERLRLALESLGPIFIKFGQMLSTRRDLLPDDIADELAKLQDQVPPFSSEQAIEIIEGELKQPIDAIFSEFDPQPLASASIAQVHQATLKHTTGKTGLDVVVKVVRPNIEKTIENDVALLEWVAKVVYKYHPDGSRLRPTEVVEDYKHTIFDELDLQKEAANTSQLRRNFDQSEVLYVPEVHWDYTRHKVLVVERIHGIPVTNIDELNEKDVNMKLLAERGVEIFFTQVFRDSFFHADMHPGNIFVDATTPEKPKYIAIDCAIIGSLSEFDQYYLARNLLAIFHRDYRTVAELHVECGWVPPTTKVGEFEAAMRSVCEPVFEKPLGEISFGQLLLYLFATARRFDMEVQPSLVLLQKTLLNIEGLGRQLYPQLDLWDTAKPFLEQWIKDRYSPKSLAKQLRKYAPGWLEQLPHVPDQIFENLALQPQRQQKLVEQQSQPRSRPISQKLAIICVICATAITISSNTNWQLPAEGWILAGLAGVLWLWPQSKN